MCEEFITDRWDRIGITYNYLSEDSHGYWVNHNKKGGQSEKSWGTAQYFEYPKTILRECELCGKRSTPKKIQHRDVAGWDLAVYIYCNHKKWKPSKDMLCMSCRNKVKPIYDARDDAIENKILINKLKREIMKWRKSQTQDN